MGLKFGVFACGLLTFVAGLNAFAVDTSRCPERIELTYFDITPIAQPDSVITDSAELKRAWEDLKSVHSLSFSVELVAMDKRVGKCNYEGGGARAVFYSAWGAEDTLDFGRVRSRVTSYSKTGVVISRDPESLAIREYTNLCGGGDCATVAYPIGHAQGVK